MCLRLRGNLYQRFPGQNGLDSSLHSVREGKNRKICDSRVKDLLKTTTLKVPRYVENVKYLD